MKATGHHYCSVNRLFNAVSIIISFDLSLKK